MKFTLGTKPNNNGNIYRVEIDTDNKTYKCGFSIVSWDIDIHATKSEIQQLITYKLKPNGYSYGGADLVISPRVYENTIIDAGRVNMDNLNIADDFYLFGAGNDIIVNPGARVRELRKLKTRAIKELNALTATISAFNHSKPETLPKLPYISANIYGDII